MKCPKCGYERQNRDNSFVPPTECPACGVIYSKHAPDQATTIDSAVQHPLHLKPSPVDPDSLQKAKERVEKRLREQLASQLRDERHAQTLELAKQFAAEQILKRQAEWQKNKEKIQPQADITELASESFDQTQQLPAVQPELLQLPKSNDTQRQMDDTAKFQSSTNSESAIAVVVPESAENSAAEKATSRPKETSHVNQTIAAEITSFNMRATSIDSPKHLIPTVQSQATDPSLYIAETAIKQQSKNHSRKGFPYLFHIGAWVILGIGIIGAVLSWASIGSVDAGIHLPIPENLSILSLGLLLGFVFLATGILGFAFFWVSSLISRQLKDIHHLLSEPTAVSQKSNHGDEVQPPLLERNIKSQIHFSDNDVSCS